MNGGAGREVLLEEFLVDRVHFSEFGEIGHEDGGFNHVFTCKGLVLKDCGNILEDLAGLFSDAALDQFAILGQRNLAGTKEEIADSHSMGVWPYRFG